VTGLKKNTAYVFEVTAVNTQGLESNASTVSSSVTTQGTKPYMFVSDHQNDRILRFDVASKAFVDVFVQKGSGGLVGPWGLAFNQFDDPDQPRTLYVSSAGTMSVLQYDACDGSFVKSFAHVPGEPRGLKFHQLPSRHSPPRLQKVLLVSNHYQNNILKVNALTGAPLGTWATGVRMPNELIIANQTANKGDVFVTSGAEDTVVQFQGGATKGVFKAKFTDKAVSTAHGFAFGDADTASKGLYVTGPYAGSLIIKFDQANGKYVSHIEDKDLKRPMGMAIHDGVLYVLDKDSVRTYDPETGEFLEVFVTEKGMNGNHLVFHEM
jgi:hypothetical protein